MILSVYYPKDYGTSYIAGTGTGVVSVNGAVAARPVYLLSADSLAVIKVFLSTSNGNYLFTGLNTKYRYIVMCRDLAPDGLEQRFEPAVWDYITPATDLTAEQQMELWQSWQTPT